MIETDPFADCPSCRGSGLLTIIARSRPHAGNQGVTIFAYARPGDLVPMICPVCRGAGVVGPRRNLSRATRCITCGGPFQYPLGHVGRPPARCRFCRRAAPIAGEVVVKQRRPAQLPSGLAGPVGETTVEARTPRTSG